MEVIRKYFTFYQIMCYAGSITSLLLQYKRHCGEINWMPSQTLIPAFIPWLAFAILYVLAFLYAVLMGFVKRYFDD